MEILMLQHARTFYTIVCIVARVRNISLDTVTTSGLGMMCRNKHYSSCIKTIKENSHMYQSQKDSLGNR